MFVLLVLAAGLGNVRGSEDVVYEGGIYYNFFRDEAFPYTENSNMTNRRPRHIIGNFSERTLLQCAAECLTSGTCFSFFYKEADSLCFLFATACVVSARETCFEEGFRYFQQGRHKYKSCVDDISGDLTSTTAGRVQNLVVKDLFCLTFCQHGTPPSGWIVIQKNLDNATQEKPFFNRNWVDFENGFGNPAGPRFWIGLKCMHALTADRPLMLRVDATDFKGNSSHALYRTFQVAGADDLYRLRAEDYISGSLGDALNADGPADHPVTHNGMQFSTPDHWSPSKTRFNCALAYNSGWWYSACHAANPNGWYGPPQLANTSSDLRGRSGIRWQKWSRQQLQVNTRFQSIRMMVRQRE